MTDAVGQEPHVRDAGLTPDLERPSFEQQLRSSGLQVTAQRLAIMEAVTAAPHATVEELTEAVRDGIGSISRQAVYDTLGALADKRLIRRIQPTGSPARFEDRVGDNHHHLVCRSCGLIFDIDCAVGSTPCLDAEQDHGFEIDEAEVVYWGRCPDCADRVTSSPKHSPNQMKPTRRSQRTT